MELDAYKYFLLINDHSQQQNISKCVRCQRFLGRVTNIQQMNNSKYDADPSIKSANIKKRNNLLQCREKYL